MTSGKTIQNAVVLVTVLVGSLGFCSAAELSPSLVAWENLLNAKGTNLIFDEYAETELPWPAEPQLSPGVKPSAEVEQLQSLVSAAIRDMRTLVRESPATPPEKRRARLDAAIRLRDNVLQDGRYSDLVLADALTRGIAVALCKQLDADEGRSNLDQSLGRLTAYQVGLEKWLSVARDEFGISKESLDQVRTADGEKEQFRSLWRVLSGGDDFLSPRNVQDEGSLDLMRSPNLALLLHRYIQTDVLLKTLSLAVQYKSRVQDFSLNDSEEKIAAVIPAPTPTVKYSLKKDGVQKVPVALDPTKYSLGERFLGLQVSFPEVARLLRATQSGDVDKQMFFDVADVVPSK